jgi:hypothetical protein
VDKEAEPTARPKIRVQMNAPTKPSTVFFGLSLINGVLPNVLPITDQINLSPTLLLLLTTDVSHHVVADDQRGGDEEPHQPFEDVVDDEVAVVSKHEIGGCRESLTSTPLRGEE